ncbi:MAG: FecR domain-containing protein [Edaphobacter sp.]|uniref:DUF6600 domain-containing protein n=1 Tax=Edaphobacter sp. TaxID=1934404 RepID=UPI0023A2CF96|nr:DUF6600 domain-containing protein [Edaphobacter sp.]MDE1176929.1 FecR domain-containing protein [Edaphobacter sp.]
MSRIFATMMLAALGIAAARGSAQDIPAAQKSTPTETNAAAQAEPAMQQDSATPPGPQQPATQTPAPAKPDPEDVALTHSIAAEGTQAGDSHVRIVRLSQVQGKVVMDRNIGRGPEATLQNMPVTQGMGLATGSDGYAEVEFEDGSSLRLAPESEVRFPLLVLHSSGQKASTILIDRGIVYLSMMKSKDSDFTLAMGKARIAVAPGTHLRLDKSGNKAELSVITGEASVQADGGAGTVVSKKQTLTLDPSGSGPTELNKEIYETAYDGWDRDAMKYHERYMKTGNNFGSTSLYGVSDLNYYGSFVGGCGSSFWQPYFVSAGWSPYSQGMWTLYSTGYSWVSPYPWGWLPYHSGAWNFCPGVGWGWQPGGSFYGLQNTAFVNTNRNLRNLVHPPGVLTGTRPEARSRSMIVQSQGPVVRSMMDAQDNFVFRRDSAGLGVPRGSLGGLHGVSHDVERHGFANREVYASPVGPVHGMMARGNHADQAARTNMQQAPLSLRRGPSPEGMVSGGDRFAWKTQQAGANTNQQRPSQNAGGARPSGAAQSSFNRSGAQASGSGGINHGGGYNGAGGGGGFHGGGSGGGGGFHGGGAPSGGGGSSSGGHSH